MIKKNILILGASNDQVPLIKTAKDLGYYVIVFDYTTTNPGLSFVDKHYQISYMERDEVLQASIENGIDGIISNSEPAMPIVAYVADKLGLVGNTTESIECLADKTKFRKLQKQLGLYCPQHHIVNSSEEAIETIKKMRLPVLLKACECSATRGTFKIEQYDELDISTKYSESKSFSWNGKVAIEEFVQMPSFTTYEGDIFIHNDEFLWDGLFYTQRSVDAPMIPMTYTGPLDFNDTNLPVIRETLSKVFRGAGIRHGQYNIELYFTADGHPFIIEVNTRQGGRELPTFIKNYCGIDFTKLLVTTSVGDNTYYEELKSFKRNYRYLAHHLLFSHQSGIYNGYQVADIITDKMTREVEYVSRGQEVREALNGTDIIGCVDFEFSNKHERDKYGFSFENNIKINITRS